MKTKRMVIAVLCLLLWSGAAVAQQPAQTSIPNKPAAATAVQGGEEDAVVSSRGTLNFDRQVVSSQLSGEQQTSPAVPSYPGAVYNGCRPNNASQWFLEYKSIVGLTEIGKGLQGAYIPGRFGGYFGFMSTRYVEWVPNSVELKWQYPDEYEEGYDRVIRYHPWFALGGVWRLREQPRRLDWQLYGGLLIGHRLGAEYGFRVAKATSSSFSWNSFSMGLLHISEVPALSIGTSFLVTSAMGLWVSLLLLPSVVTITY